MAEAGKREKIQIGRALRLDRRTALDLLLDLARDRGVLADLRRLWAKETATTTLCFASDDQVLTQLAARVASGSLIIARVPPPLPKAPPAEEGTLAGDAATSASAASPAPASHDPPPQEPPDEMLASVDAAAQAAVLERAAQDGTPFCEECERRRAVAA